MINKLYQRVTKKCKTINQHNMVLIALENRLTPLELSKLLKEGKLFWRYFYPVIRVVAKIIESINNDYSDRQRNVRTLTWKKKTSYLFNRSGKIFPETFIRTRISKHSILFSDSSKSAKDKTLIICFVGRAQRMMMPTPVFLQHFDAKNVDIVLIRYPKRSGYKFGLEKVGKNYKETLDNLFEILPSARYKNTVAIGTSGGAAPAVLAALYHNLSSVLAVGINSLEDSRWNKALGMNLDDYANSIMDISTKQTKVSLICGIDHPKDIRSSLEWKQFIENINIIQISDKKEKVGHNALLPLLKKGEFSEFINSILIKE